MCFEGLTCHFAFFDQGTVISELVLCQLEADDDFESGALGAAVCGDDLAQGFGICLRGLSGVIGYGRGEEFFGQDLSTGGGDRDEEGVGGCVAAGGFAFFAQGAVKGEFEVDGDAAFCVGAGALAVFQSYAGDS